MVRPAFKRDVVGVLRGTYQISEHQAYAAMVGAALPVPASFTDGPADAAEGLGDGMGATATEACACCCNDRAGP